MAQVTVEAKYIADTAQYVQALRRAAEATNALADIIPDADSAQQTFTKGTQQAGAAAGEAAKGFTILRNAIGTAIGVSAVNLVMGLTGRLKAFARQSFDAAARVEELDIAMKAIGESTGIGAKAIQEATQAIRDNGIELGASQQIAIEFAQNQLDMAAASKVARVAQDLAVIAGKNSTATTQLLTRAIITGNSMLLKSAGISKTASEGHKDFAASIGKTVGQLTANERQQSVTNLIIAEGAKVAGTYEASMDSAGKVLRSFARIINDMQVEMGKVLLDAFGPLIKASYDLLSAFSRSMREGGALNDVIANLTVQFQGLINPLVETVKRFTEMVKEGDGLRDIGNQVNQIIPIFTTLFEVVRAGAGLFGAVLAPGLRALGSILKSVAPLVERIAQFIENLPAPIKTAVGALLIMQIALRRFGISLAQANAAMGAFALRTVASFRAASVAAVSFRTVTIGAFAAVKTAARTLMAALGPIGLLLIGMGVAFEIVAGKSADTEAKMAELRDTVDEGTRAVTELTKQTAQTQLKDLLSAEDLAMLARHNITLEEMVEALMQGGDAVEAVGQKFNDAINPVDRFLFAFGDKAALKAAERNFGGAVKHMEELRLEAELFAAEQLRDNEALRASNQQMAHASANSYSQISAAAQIASEIVARSGMEGITQAERHKAAMDQLSEATAAAVEKMTGAFNRLKGAISLDAAIDNAHTALEAMRKQLASNTAGIEGFSKGAKANRKVLREYVSGLVAVAEGLDDPSEKLEILRAAEEEVRKQLGKDAPKSRVLQELTAQIEEVEDSVTTFDDARANAEAAGIDVTEALIRGIVETVGDAAGSLNAAGVGAGAAVEEGLYDSLGVSSPSTKAIYAANMVVLGLVQGLRSGEGPVAAAMRDMIRAGLDAARKEAGIASPSRVTELMGEMHQEGFTEGIKKNTKKTAQVAKFSAQKIMSAFSGGLDFGSGFTGGAGFMDQLQSFFGTLPSLPSPLEAMFGKGGSEAFLKKHEKDLVVVQRVFGELDQVSSLVMDGTSRLREIHGRMTGVQGLYQGEPIEAPSELLKAIGPEGNLSSAVGMLSQMTSDIDRSFEILLQTVNKGQQKAVRAQRKAVSGYMQAMGQEIKGLMIRREQIQTELRAIEKTYSDNITAINTHYGALTKAARGHLTAVNTHFNSLITEAQNGIKKLQKHYSGLEKSARATIDQIRKRYDALIPQLQAQLKSTTDAFEAENRVLQNLINERDRFTDQVRSGFRSFVNSLQFETQQSTKAVLKETKKLANGITVILEREIEVGGGRENIAAALKGRLEAIQEFSRNIRTLMGRGLDPTLVQEFVSAGVAGAGDVVRELAGVSADEISEINRIQQQLGSEIASFQEYGVQQFHAAAIAQQEAIVAPLETARQQAEAALQLAEESRTRDLESAQAHLDTILAMRDQDLENAQAYLERLQEDKDREVAVAQAALDQLETARDAALEAERVAYDAQRKVLEAEALLIDGELKARAEAVRKYFAQLMSGPRGLPVMMRKAGIRTMQGLLNGLNSVAPQVLGRAREIADQIRSIIESALAIRSPSRVMETIGMQVGLGLVEGMDESQRAVERAARGLATAIAAPMFAPEFPNNFGSPSSSFKGSGGGTVININVTAPPLTDPAEVGRQVVEAVRKYERRSGPVFVSAT